MPERQFPILRDYQDKKPRRESIPWEMIAPHERRARLNHSQDLERLAERGGLSVHEMLCVLRDVGWWATMATPEQEHDHLEQLVRAYEAVRAG